MAEDRPPRTSNAVPSSPPFARIRIATNAQRAVLRTSPTASSLPTNEPSAPHSPRPSDRPTSSTTCRFDLLPYRRRRWSVRPRARRRRPVADRLRREAEMPPTCAMSSPSRRRACRSPIALVSCPGHRQPSRTTPTATVRPGRRPRRRQGRRQRIVPDVRDDGPGIPPEQRHRIFQRFGSTDPTSAVAWLGHRPLGRRDARRLDRPRTCPRPVCTWPAGCRAPPCSFPSHRRPASADTPAPRAAQRHRPWWCTAATGGIPSSSPTQESTMSVRVAPTVPSGPVGPPAALGGLSSCLPERHWPGCDSAVAAGVGIIGGPVAPDESVGPGRLPSSWRWRLACLVVGRPGARPALPFWCPVVVSVFTPVRGARVAGLDLSRHTNRCSGRPSPARNDRRP